MLSLRLFSTMDVRVGPACDIRVNPGVIPDVVGPAGVDTGGMTQQFGNQPVSIGSEDRTAAALAHAASLIAMVISAGWLSFVGQIIGHVIGILRATKGESMDYPFQIKVLS